jgi:prevent-host-death family protein
MSSPRTISASDFKARCLGVLDEVQKVRTEVIITKRGKPVARLLPVGQSRGSLRGAWKDLVRVRGDIVAVDWTSEFEAAE